jgi:hypothetical protein
MQRVSIDRQRQEKRCVDKDGGHRFGRPFT